MPLGLFYKYGSHLYKHRFFCNQIPAPPKELLGIPTANIPPEGLSAYPDLRSGVYFGFVGLSRPPITDSSPATSTPTPRSTTAEIYPSVLSIGYNPYYKNTVRSVEIHILQEFKRDFYGAALNLLILGFIRPEYDYVSLEALVRDIRVDCEVAERSLKRDAYARFKDVAERGDGDGDGDRDEHEDEDARWLTRFEWVDGVDAAEVERKVLAKQD
ncbi:riboflavin kinase [Exophiala aquamarina CBS 119918]|uniref:Riboflavin kinase n=1 Tax=Exophiala aquamarina CBS 119918 TaxID=1182545 RepID=A0A072P2V1_9EURO|nr:riboflavin kinase [Exophiala aquamarina CBS 119918]KEF54429.1 riboflavin kinase [Exophiala aquamarina CBS 119918]